jgi:hypothetical protein
MFYRFPEYENMIKKKKGKPFMMQSGRRNPLPSETKITMLLNTVLTRCTFMTLRRHNVNAWMACMGHPREY